jgi:hypothetical protein
MINAQNINSQVLVSSANKVDEKATSSYLEHFTGANLVPIVSETITEISKINAGNSIIPEMARHPNAQILSKRGAPSTISSERFLKSRSLFSPEFIHNEASSRISRLSDSYREAPRFRSDVDILA